MMRRLFLAEPSSGDNSRSCSVRASTGLEGLQIALCSTSRLSQTADSRCLGFPAPVQAAHLQIGESPQLARLRKPAYPSASLRKVRTFYQGIRRSPWLRLSSFGPYWASCGLVRHRSRETPKGGTLAKASDHACARSRRGRSRLAPQSLWQVWSEVMRSDKFPLCMNLWPT